MGKARVWSSGTRDWSPRLGQQHRCNVLNWLVGACWGWNFSAFAETQSDSRKELLLIISVIQRETHLPLFKQASVDPLGNNNKKASRGTVQVQKLHNLGVLLVFAFFKGDWNAVAGRSWAPSSSHPGAACISVHFAPSHQYIPF